MTKVAIKPTNTFDLEFRGKSYPCEILTVSGRAIYKINFGKSYLHLTKVNALDGPSFWGPIPEDPKLGHVCAELGVIIENFLKR
jgi:hypothetical protein